MTAKIERAVTQTTQYLKVLNIPFQVEGTTLNIQSASGNKVVVVLVSGTEHVPEDTVRVSVDELINKNTQISKQAFAKITEAAGYGNPAPVKRGTNPATKKLRYQDNFELVTMRHREFRKAPNPPAEKYEEYKDIITGASKRFYMRNIRYLTAHGMELDDCIQYAMVWATNYFGLYEVVSANVAQRKGRLYKHLCQRFGELAKNLEKKGRSCIPNTSVCRLGMGLTEHEESESASAFLFNLQGEEEVDAEYVARRNQLGKGRGVSGRRNGATKLLAELLASLPHDEMLEKLREVEMSPHQNYFAKKEARRQIAKHVKACASCSASQEEK